MAMDVVAGRPSIRETVGMGRAWAVVIINLFGFSIGPCRKSKGRELETAKEQPGLFPVKGIVLAYSRPIMVKNDTLEKGMKKALITGKAPSLGSFRGSVKKQRHKLRRKSIFF